MGSILANVVWTRGYRPPARRCLQGRAGLTGARCPICRARIKLACKKKPQRSFATRVMKPRHPDWRHSMRHQRPGCGDQSLVPAGSHHDGRPSAPHTTALPCLDRRGEEASSCLPCPDHGTTWRSAAVWTLSEARRYHPRTLIRPWQGERKRVSACRLHAVMWTYHHERPEPSSRPKQRHPLPASMPAGRALRSASRVIP